MACQVTYTLILAMRPTPLITKVPPADSVTLHLQVQTYEFFLSIRRSVSKCCIYTKKEKKKLQVYTMMFTQF